MRIVFIMLIMMFPRRGMLIVMLVRRMRILLMLMIVPSFFLMLAACLRFSVTLVLFRRMFIVSVRFPLRMIMVVMRLEEMRIVFQRRGFVFAQISEKGFTPLLPGGRVRFLRHEYRRD